MNIFELIISLFVMIPNKEVNVVENVNLNYYNGSWYQYYTNYYSLFFNDISNCSKYNFNVLNDTNYLLEESYLDNQLITKLNSQGILENSILENDYGLIFNIESYIIKNGPVINNEYRYSILTDDIGFSLVLLVRDIKEFESNYQDDVNEFLNEFFFKVPDDLKFIFNSIKINHLGC